MKFHALRNSCQPRGTEKCPKKKAQHVPKKIEGRWGHDDEQVTPSSRGLERYAANHLPATRSKTGKVSGDVYARTQFRDRESERRRQRQPGFKALRSPAKRESKSSHVACPTPHMQRLARAYHAATAYLNPGHALVGFDLRPRHQLHNLNIGRHKIRQAGRVLLYCGATLSCRPIDPLAHRHLNAARGIAADGDVEEHNRERHGGC